MPTVTWIYPKYETRPSGLRWPTPEWTRELLRRERRTLVQTAEDVVLLTEPTRSARHRLTTEQLRKLRLNGVLKLTDNRPLLSRYAKHAPLLFAEAQGQRIRLVLYERVSGWEQKRGGNVDKRLARLQDDLKAMGVALVDGCYRDDGISGRAYQDGRGFLEARPGFWAALKRARQLKGKHPDDIVIVSTSTFSRLVRPENYRGTAGSFHLCTTEVEVLATAADGVQLVTTLHPDASFVEEKQYIESLGERKKPGAMRAKRERDRPRACRLRARGETIAFIAKYVRRPKSTVYGWVRNVRVGGPVQDGGRVRNASEPVPALPRNPHPIRLRHVTHREEAS